MTGRIAGIMLLALVCHAPGSMAQAPMPADTSAAVVEYQADFFTRYNPNTALDMINQTPGFLLDDGDASRGLGAAAGNILINDRRPSAKQDLPSLILTRIPASQVERIEIIRAQVRDIDLQGQPVVANIILRNDSPAAIRWDASWRYNVEYFSTFEGSISIADRWRETDYNAGLNLRRFTRGDETPQQNFDGNGELFETRFDDADLAGYRGGGNLTTTSWFGLTRVQTNANFFAEDREGLRFSSRRPVTSAGIHRDEIIGEDFRTARFELGLDAERRLREDLTGKLIGVVTDGFDDTLSTLRRKNAAGSQTLYREADSGTDETEAIGRIELDWAFMPDHTLQGNVELAYNSLAGELVQTEDTGNGPVEVAVPGANTKVEETRWEFLLKDTWSLGQFELDYGVGAETSTITQTGDAQLERDFFFIKPQAVLTWSADRGAQTRLRVAREVAQLNFVDFISATVFEDDDLALGNPNLRPDSTWIAEVGHERRFGPESVLKLTVFHHWVSDVLDLLPITPTFEAPGNIGDGTRWGFNIETSMPLEWTGLTGARLEVNGRWQKSSVTDPVTGEQRVFSSRTRPGAIFPLSFRDDNRFALIVDFRQDFQQARMAWGWDLRTRAERPLYKVNEFDVLDDGHEFNVFIESTRWFGVKTKIIAENLFDMVEQRDRTIYTGYRGLSPVATREYRERLRGFRMSFELNGSF